MTPPSRCPDCGERTTHRLCTPCTDVADALGITIDERLSMLGVLEEATPA